MKNLVSILLLCALTVSANPFLPILTGSVAAAGGSSFPTTSLIAFYKLNEASGDALDSSGNSRTFTQVGTVGASSGTIGGASVATRSFTDASLNYFQRADDANFDVGTGDFTVAAWIKISSAMADGDGGIFGKRNGTAATDAGYSMGLEPFGTQIWTMAYDNVCDGVSAPAYGDSQIPGVAEEEWHHYMWVFTRAGSLILYVDGASSKTVSISGANGNADNSIASQIGRITFNNSGGFKGELTHLGFWKKALDTTERGNLYNTGHVLAPP